MSYLIDQNVFFLDFVKSEVMNAESDLYVRWYAVLHAVASGQNPLVTDDGATTEVIVVWEELVIGLWCHDHLPRKLSDQCVLSANYTPVIDWFVLRLSAVVGELESVWHANATNKQHTECIEHHVNANCQRQLACYNVNCICHNCF